MVPILEPTSDAAAEYADNRARMEALVAELRERTDRIATERPPQAVERHEARARLPLGLPRIRLRFRSRRRPCRRRRPPSVAPPQGAKEGHRPPRRPVRRRRR